MDEETFVGWVQQLSELEPGAVAMITGHLVMRVPQDFSLLFEIEHWPSELTLDQAIDVLQLLADKR